MLKAFFKDKLKQAYHGWFMQGMRGIKRSQIVTVVEMLWRGGIEREKDAPLVHPSPGFEVHILVFDTRNTTFAIGSRRQAG